MLLVDIGNSRIKWRVLNADGSLGARHVYTHEGAAPDKWAGRLWTTLAKPDKIIIANVAGQKISDALEDWTRRHWQLEPRFAVSKIHELGVHNGYDNPDHLGVDRWVAMLGARKLTQQHSVVIDCGTAVTVDALNNIGDHLGGVILPGVRLMHTALYRNTKLKVQQPPDDLVMLGTNTRDCIWGGTMHALAAAIDRFGAHMRAHMQDKSDGECELLITGGNAPSLLPYLENDYRLEPDLIFIGLKQIALQKFKL